MPRQWVLRWGQGEGKGRGILGERELNCRGKLGRGLCASLFLSFVSARPLTVLISSLLPAPVPLPAASP